jgi:hypothetical protein
VVAATAVTHAEEAYLVACCYQLGGKTAAAKLIVILVCAYC